MRRGVAILWVPAAATLIAATAPSELRSGDRRQASIAPGEISDWAVRLGRGEAAEIAVLQEGVDLVVELLGPDGARLATIDSPNGRQGEEPVSIAASRAGLYTIRVRPIAAGEPAGRFTIVVKALLDRAAARARAERRRRDRAEASAWLRARRMTWPPAQSGPPSPLDRLAAEARVVGLGEATHGSREFGDVRLALVKRLVERHDYRLIALEDSSARWRALAGYVGGEPGAEAGTLEWGWIGRRPRRELLDWVREWNLAHPGDRVRIVGVDAQDNQADRDVLDRFIGDAYGPEAAARWAPAAADLAAADEQSQVFGDSGLGEATRQLALEARARLEADAPLLRARLGSARVEEALAAAANLAQFADFNQGGGLVAHSRDWYMAVNLLDALDRLPEGKKAAYWAHNAHVSAAKTGWGPTGALLREALGCGYRAVALTFGEGSFIAQIPNDPADRLVATRLATPGEESLEAVLAGAGRQSFLAAWSCGADSPPPPAWLGEPRPMRWIGGLYAPDSDSAAAYRPYRLTEAFDAVVYLPVVTAEPIPPGRPLVPPRKR